MVLPAGIRTAEPPSPRERQSRDLIWSRSVTQGQILRRSTGIANMTGSHVTANIRPGHLRSLSRALT